MEGYNMTTLMKRLEAATSRLEDLVVAQNAKRLDANGPALVVSESPAPSTTSAGTELASGAMSAPVSPKTPSPSPEQVHSAPSAAPSVKSSPGVDALRALRSELDAFVDLAKQVNPLVESQSEAFARAADAMTEIAAVSVVAKKPDMASSDYADLLKPLSEAAGAVVNIRDDNRAAREVGNHLATLSEAVPALGWVSVDSPAEYIQDFKDSAQFYGNRVLKDDKAHAPWLKALYGYLDNLKKVAANHFPQGLEWNPSGVTLAEAAATKAPAVKAPAATTKAAAPPPPPPPGGAGGPPPPPPPPSVEQLTAGLDKAPAAGSNNSEGGMSAVFSELNQGENITSGLKHVDRKAARANLPPKPALKPKAKPASSSTTAGASTTAAKPKQPKTELVDKRWIVENYVGRSDLVIEGDMTQSVLIDNCADCVVQVKGKVATVSVSRCTKTGVAAENLVAGIEVVKCSDFKLQVTGVLPSLNIEQSHSGHVYLGEHAIDADIYTAQSTSINVNIPTGEEGDWKELPLPEQIVHKIVDRHIQSKALTAGNI